MPDPKPPTPIHPDIPLTQAWKTGRRIYVRSGYRSQLNTELREAGASWDAKERALWVGTGKLDQVLPLIQEHQQRIAQAVAVKAAGLWVVIPYDAAAIRAAAKTAGARWDQDRKAWAMPTPETYQQITDQVSAWQRKLAEQKAAADAAARAARLAAERQEQENAALTAAARAAQLLTASARTATGEHGTATGRLPGRMRQAEAETRKPQPGQTVRLRDGRRVLVLTCAVDFWSQDAIDDGVVGDPSMDPGWYYRYEFATVEPTADEQAADAAAQAEQDDENTIAALLLDVSRGADLAEVGPDTPRPPAGGHAIRRTSGSVQPTPDGTVTLVDGRVWWQHPGYYDDYRAVSGRVTDPTIVARVQAVVAGGTRRRGAYTVTVRP